MPLIPPADYPVPTTGKTRYISPIIGDDTTGDGTRENPFLTATKAYDSIPTDTQKWYIVVMDGLYSIDLLERKGASAASTNQGASKIRTALMFGANKSTITQDKNVCIMAEHIGSSLLQGSVDIIPTTDAPLSSGALRYHITEAQVAKNIGNKDLVDLPPYIRDIPTTDGNIVVDDKDEDIAYTTMFEWKDVRSDTGTPNAPPEKWASQGLQFAITREIELGDPTHGNVDSRTTSRNIVTDANVGFTANGPDCFVTVGSETFTHFKIVQDGNRTDVIDMATRVLNQYPDINLIGTNFVVHNGNNRVNFAVISKITIEEDLDFATGNVTKRCTALYIDRRLQGAVRGAGFVGNKLFLTKEKHFGMESEYNIPNLPQSKVKTNNIFYIPPNINKIEKKQLRLSAISHAFIGSKISNLEVVGFNIFEFNESAWGRDDTQQSLPGGRNNKIKYNIVHDCVCTNGVGAIQMGGDKHFEVSGNLLYRLWSRVITTVASQDLETTDFENSIIKNNVILWWNNSAGIYSQSAKNITIDGNTIFTIFTQHADAIACYVGCFDINIVNNFVYTPTLIGLAVENPATYYETQEGKFTITNNVFVGSPGFTIRSVAASQGKNTRFTKEIGEQGLTKSVATRGDLTKFEVLNNYTTSGNSSFNIGIDPWWALTRRVFRNNIAESIGSGLQFTSDEAMSFLMAQWNAQGRSGGLNGTYNVLGETDIVFPQSVSNGVTTLGSTLSIPADAISARKRILPAGWSNTTAANSPLWIVSEFIPPAANGITYNRNPLLNFAHLYDTHTDTKPKFLNNLIVSTNSYDQVVPVANPFIALPSLPGTTPRLPTVSFTSGDSTNNIHKSVLADPTSTYTPSTPFIRLPDDNLADRKFSVQLACKDPFGEIAASTGTTKYHDFRINNRFSSSFDGELVGPNFIGPEAIGIVDYFSWWSHRTGVNKSDSVSVTGQNQVPISNHPITISLTTTDIDSSISWNNKNADAQHGLDGFYDSGNQIPNYLNEISVITNPQNIVHIGDSRSNERAGDDNSVAVNQGGIRIDKTEVLLPNISVGGTNSLTITNLVQKFGNEARNQGGNTFAIILHGKTEPSPGCTFAEFKYVTPEIYETSEDWEAAGSPTDADRPGFHFPDFHKKSAYISFHSKEASKTGLITSDSAFSFRKSVHHKYKKFIPRIEFIGISCSNAINGISEIHVATSNPGNINWLSNIIAGSTCNINLRSIYPSDPITSANKVAGLNTSPNTISCLSKTIEFVSFSNNIIKLKNKSATSLFSGINPTDTRLTIQHNGAVACSDTAFNFNSSVSDYRIPAPIEASEQEFTLRVQNEIGNGSSNLLAYKVPLNAIRLFSSPNTPTNILNLGITTGSYIRVSGSASNNGIYQVLSVIDGIQDDTLSNTKTNNATEFQYLELSRNIIPENSSTANSISVENVSHYPILHVKYQTPV